MKQIKYVMAILISFFIFDFSVQAASLSVSAGSYTVYKGSSVKVTAKVSDAAGKFSFKTSNSSVLSGGGTTWIENGSASYTFKASKTGTAKITVTSIDAAAFSTGNAFNTSKSVTIKVVEKPVEQPKSSVNALSKLGIEYVDLTPKFDQDTTEYTVDLEPNTEKIKIYAEAKDSKASINGTGEKTVSEGMNTFEVVVTAENGSKKTYTLKVNVKEAEPIVAKVNETDLNVVQKRKDLPEVGSNYTETTVTMNDKEIPAYLGQITNFTLVGLKNEEGKIQYYIYNAEAKTYIPYQELNFNKIVLYPLNIKEEDIPTGYRKTTVMMANIEVEAYQNTKDEKYYLIYGMNTETGKTNLYQYDQEEETLQRYSKANMGSNQSGLEKKWKLVMIVGFSILALFLAMLYGFIKNIRKLKN